MSAAESRHNEKVQLTKSAASEVVLAAEKVRLKRLNDERAALEERKLRLDKQLEQSLGRRETSIATIQAKAAKVGCKAAAVVKEHRSDAELACKDAAHVLAVKMQAAEVNALHRMHQHKAKPPVLIVIPAFDEVGSVAGKAATMALLPPPKLLERLMFRPRLLLATSKARQLAAAGRRATYAALITARAAHFGSVRVARVLGRKAAHIEICRSLHELKCNAAASKGAAILAATRAKAHAFNRRVVAAKLQRSTIRLALLNDAIVAESRRKRAELRRDIALQNRAVTAKAEAKDRKSVV